MNSNDTIVAISTPPGRSGIGVVRLSGNRALEIAEQLVRKKDGALGSLEPRRATLVTVWDSENSFPIDESIVVFYALPHSYTGENLVELSCHGSPVVLERVVYLAMKEGARLAEPGEFTLRAFMNGRIDLVQAEAIQDLIEAKTLYQAQVAVQQAHGSLSRILSPFKEQLVDLVSLLEAGIDFAEDDVAVLAADVIEQRLEKLLDGLAPILQSFVVGRIIREGISLAIIGRPNVGKSSLFNRLLASDRAIVTELPGTTRDTISEVAQVHGVPIRFVDTAGIRETSNVVEQKGVDRSYAALAECDLVLLVLDGARARDSSDEALLRLVAPLKHLFVLNKCDLDRVLAASHAFADRKRVVPVSALTGEGIESLREAIYQLATDYSAREASSQGILTNLRHQQLLSSCRHKLQAAQELAKQGEAHEMVLLDLYGALHALDTITGATTVDDILGNIFSRFCIGK